MKRSARKDKRRCIEELTNEAETAAGQRNMKKKLYDINRTLSGKTVIPAAQSKIRMETYSQVKRTKELDGLNILRKH